MTYLIDIDNTICQTDGLKYEESKPYISRIEKINELYDSGNKIVVWTGRGISLSPEECLKVRAMTYEQLKSWGLKFHSLIMKPVNFDLVIDDKSIDPDSFFS